jgi:hypothetical protein
LQVKPAVLSQATDKADLSLHLREIHGFKIFKLEKEKKITDGGFRSENSKCLPWLQNKSTKINGPLQFTTYFICGQKEHLAHQSK